MWLVEVSIISGWRAAGRKRWQWFNAHRCEPPLITLRGIGMSGVSGSKLPSGGPPRGLLGRQQGLAVAAFVALFFFDAPFPLVVLAAGLYGGWRGRNNGHDATALPVASWNACTGPNRDEPNDSWLA